MYLAKCKESKQQVALKVLFKSHLSSGTAPLLLRREVEVRQGLITREPRVRPCSMKRLRRPSLPCALVANNCSLRPPQIQSRLDHRNILRMVGWFTDPKSVYLALEVAAGGEVYKIMTDAGGRLPCSQATSYLVGIARALKYLKERGIMHRDIKPENLLVGGDGEVKLSDFGWAVHAIGSER